jgi:hypothetical protein
VCDLPRDAAIHKRETGLTEDMGAYAQGGLITCDGLNPASVLTWRLSGIPARDIEVGHPLRQKDE